MYRKQLLALAGIAGIGALALSAPANAATVVTIGLQEAGFNSGAITNEGTAGGYIGNYGTFSTNIVGGSAQSTPYNLLTGTSLNTSSSSAGTLNVFITASGLTAPLGAALSFLSSFTENTLDPAISSVVLSTYLSSGNALFGGTLLDTATFTTIGTSVMSNTGNTGTGPYSVTEEFTITATGAGTAASTTNLSSTPLPGAISLFGGGLGVIGLLARRKKRKGLTAISAIA